MTTTPSGAQFEILVDGKPRSYRDIRAVAIASAEFLKSKRPQQRGRGQEFEDRRDRAGSLQAGVTCR
jgi:hypothetical protein